MLSLSGLRAEEQGEGLSLFQPRHAAAHNSSLLRPLVKTSCLLVPYGYIIFKIKRIPKEMTNEICLTRQPALFAGRS